MRQVLQKLVCLLLGHDFQLVELYRPYADIVIGNRCARCGQCKVEEFSNGH